MKTLRVFLSLMILLLALSSAACRKKTPEELLADASDAFQRGDLIGAIYKTRDIIDRYPDSEAALEARMLLAVSEMRNNDFQSARANLDEVIDRAGLGHQIGQMAFLEKMRTFETPEERIEAIENSLEALQSAPELAQQVQVALGQLYFQAGETEKAREHLLAIIENAEAEQDVMLPMQPLISILVMEKEFDEALKLYDRFIERYPESMTRGSAHFGKAMVYREMAEEAETKADRLAAEANADAALNRSAAVYREELETELLERNRVSLAVTLSQVYRVMEDNAGADAVLNSMLEEIQSDDSRLGILSEFVDASARQGDFAKAREYLLTIQDSFPGSQIADQAGNAIRYFEMQEMMLSQQDAPTTEAFPTDLEVDFDAHLSDPEDDSMEELEGEILP